MSVATPTRRGFLGLFAAAVPTVMIGATIAETARGTAIADWRTKPVDQWTKLDFLAEAEFHVRNLRAKFAAEPFDQDSAVNRGRKGQLSFWERELACINSGLAA